MSRDFTDRVEAIDARCLCYRCVGDGGHAGACGDRPPPAAFTGLRCDAVHCGLRLPGKTETREQLRTLTLRAESLGWQCRFVDGEARHWCPDHVDVDRERLRRLYR